jgi:hypothetical protein
MDVIFMISPEETPFLSLIGRKGCESRFPEWQKDTLAVPDETNAQIEGDDWTYDAVVPTERVGNHTQISDKKIIISRTQERVSKAGRRSELAREVRKKGVELRTDMEIISMFNQASLLGSDVLARQSGGFRAWLETNTDLGATGVDGGFNTGTSIVDAATNGTQRAFTKTILDNLIESVYTSGGNPTVLMTSPYVKRVFSTFMSDTNVAQFRTNMSGKKQGVVTAAADIYISDFGEISVVPNRQMARHGADSARNAFLITPDMVELAVLDPVKLEKPAKTGDAHKRVLITEWTLCVKNEEAHGVAADLFGLTAAS